jgi:hypothetical protein
MHPRKAETLAAMNKSLGLVDRAIQRNVGIISAPRHHSWGQLGVALGALPLYALAGALFDLCYVRVARSANEAWDRIPPSEPKSE